MAGRLLASALSERGIVEASLDLASAIADILADAERDARAEVREAAANPAVATRAAIREAAYREIRATFRDAGKRAGKSLAKGAEGFSGRVAKETAAALAKGAKRAARGRALSGDALANAVGGIPVDELCAVHTENMSRSAIRQLRTAFVRTFNQGAAEGWDRLRLRDVMQIEWNKVARSGSAFRFVDAGGRRWRNDVYARMLVRTTLARVERETFIRTMVENGYDLARVSHAGTRCKKCLPWEGRKVSLTGATKGYPTYADALAAGLFHPNCMHTLEFVSMLID